jgi:hypothetical protein
MKNTRRIVLAVALLLNAAACHKDDKAAQLKALDNAYKAGVFTKEEYDAKKQVLMGTPAAATAPPASVTAPPEQTTSPPAPASASARTAQPAQTAAQGSVSSPALAPAPQIPASPVPLQRPAPAVARAAESEKPEPGSSSGCLDAESRSGGSNGVQERFFPVPEEAVRKAAATAFANLDFIIHRDSGHEMEASKRRHLSAVFGGGGERLILSFSRVQRGGQSGTRVLGETKKSIAGRLAQKSWTSAVLAQIACNLRARGR